MKSHYEILEIPRSATQKEISNAHKRLRFKWHPDKNMNNLEEATAKFKEIQTAYDTLSDIIKKYDYDRTLPPETKPTPSKPSVPPKSSSWFSEKKQEYKRDDLSDLFSSYNLNSDEDKPKTKTTPSSSTTKTISKIAKGEKLEHKGDLIIEEDIEEGAELKIIDGSLTVRGNIRAGAKVTGSSPSGNKGGVTFTAGGGVRVTGGASVSISNINGVETIYVNGKRVDRNSPQAESKPSNITVQGEVMDNVTITTEDEIQVAQNIGKNCNIKTKSGGVTAKNVGDGTSIATYKNIDIVNAGDDCEFNSEMYGLNANTIGKSARINTYKDVIVDQQIGAKSNVKSSMYGITVRNMVCDDVTFHSYKDISVKNVGNSCDFTSSMYGVKLLGKAGDNFFVSAYKNIEINSVGSGARITSSMYGVTIKDLGPRAKVRAYKDIILQGNYSSDADCESSMGKVRKYGSVVNKSFFEKKPESTQTQEGIPPQFLCPLTNKIMLSPMIYSEDSKTYEEKAIRGRLKELGYEKNTIDDMLTPNRVLIAQIAAYLDAHPEHNPSIPSHTYSR